MPPPLISVTQASEQLKIRPRTLRDIAIRLQIGTRYGSIRLFTPADLARIAAYAPKFGRPRQKIS